MGNGKNAYKGCWQLREQFKCSLNREWVHCVYDLGPKWTVCDMIELVEDRYAFRCRERAGLQEGVMYLIAHQRSGVIELRDVQQDLAEMRSVMICEKQGSDRTGPSLHVQSSLMPLVVSWALGSKVENCSVFPCHACWQFTAKISYWLIHWCVWLIHRILFLSLCLWVFVMAR